jgi:hypothetical protein
MAQDGGEYGRVDRQGGCPAFEEDATVFTGVRERGATGRMHSFFLLHRPRVPLVTVDDDARGCLS